MGIGAAAGAGWETWPPFAPGPPFLFNSLSLCLEQSSSPLELFLQRLGALVPEVSHLLTVVTMIILPFSVISHSDGGRIDLGVESHFYIVPVLQGVIIIDVRWNLILFGLNLHCRLHLCSVDGDVGTVVIVLPVIMCLILMIVIQPPLVWICVVGSVRGLTRGWGVCLAHTLPIYSCSAEPRFSSHSRMAISRGVMLVWGSSRLWTTMAWYSGCRPLKKAFLA